MIGMSTRRRAFAVIFGTGLLSLVAACGGGPPPPGIVDLTITAGDDINPDAGGRASPVVLRVYQLAAGTQFQAADFFQLFDKETPTLGADLVGREDVTIAPGATRNLTIPLKPNAQAIGIAVSFRDIDQAAWRAVIDVPQNKTTKLKSEVKKLQVSLAKG
jgi:type VI secretion system protein VasD